MFELHSRLLADTRQLGDLPSAVFCWQRTASIPGLSWSPEWPICERSTTWRQSSNSS